MGVWGVLKQQQDVFAMSSLLPCPAYMPCFHALHPSSPLHPTPPPPCFPTLPHTTLHSKKQVRCRSPWYGVAGLVKSMEEAPDTETPTASSGVHRLGSFSVADGGSLPPPPPPPPRTSSTTLGLAGGPPSYDAELKLLFFGDPALGLEPVSEGTFISRGAWQLLL